MTQPARPSGDKIRMIEVGGTEIFIVRSKWGHILPASFASDEKASAAVGAEEKEIEIVADGNVTGGPWHVARIPTEYDAAMLAHAQSGSVSNHSWMSSARLGSETTSSSVSRTYLPSRNRPRRSRIS